MTCAACVAPTRGDAARFQWRHENAEKVIEELHSLVQEAVGIEPPDSLLVQFTSDMTLVSGASTLAVVRAVQRLSSSLPAIDAPADAGPTLAFLGVSVGIAYACDASVTPESVVRNAVALARIAVRYQVLIDEGVRSALTPAGPLLSVLPEKPTMRALLGADRHMAVYQLLVWPGVPKPITNFPVLRAELKRIEQTTADILKQLPLVRDAIAILEERQNEAALNLVDDKLNEMLNATTELGVRLNQSNEASQISELRDASDVMVAATERARTELGVSESATEVDYRSCASRLGEEMRTFSKAVGRLHTAADAAILEGDEVLGLESFSRAPQ